MNNENEMCVIKRNGLYENVSFDKILSRVKNLGSKHNPPLTLNYSQLVMKVIDQLYPNISTTKIDELTAEQCASLGTKHPDYGILASRIIISNNHKNTPATFYDAMDALYNFRDVHNLHSPLISSNIWDVICNNKDKLNIIPNKDNDFLIDYFGFKTLERAYLMKVDNVTVETPQYMWLRVALGIHSDNLDLVEETYNLMSQKYFTHATPTLYNAGTPRQQLSSCYLIGMEDDSITGIYNTLNECANISKWAGGIGLHIHNVRATGSHIRGTNGTSNGIVPMLRVFNMTARYVDQCVTPETFIYTRNGPIQIQNCEIDNTAIYTTDGLELIENVLEHPYDDLILSIDDEYNFEPLLITPEHPVYCLQNNSNFVRFVDLYNKLESNEIEPEWIDAKDLKLNDMLVYKIPDFNIDNVNIKSDDCYIYGLLMNCGNIDNSSRNFTLTLKFSENNYRIMEFVKEYLEKKCILFSESRNNEYMQIEWEKNIILPFRYSNIYNSNKEKHIHHSWLNLPIYKSKYIIKGLVDSTGKIDDTINYYNPSRTIIESCRYILLKMGIIAKIVQDSKMNSVIGSNYFGANLFTGLLGKTLNKEENLLYKIIIPKNSDMCSLFKLDTKNYAHFFRYRNLLFSKIQSIKKEHYTGTLYDLQLKTTHDYMIHNGIVHNGGGKRNGSFAIYLEPWHGDIYEFLDLKKNHGDEEMRARDLFYALWIPDLFMEKVQNDEDWNLFCPDQCPGLSDSYGENFKNLYNKYSVQNKQLKTVKARELWLRILDSQMETGTPYILYKDAANNKSNQKNLGTIKSSNLCCEIIEYSDHEQTAVCNLASIGLTRFVNSDKTFDYDKLHEVTKVITNNLNKIIDINFYPTEKTRLSNFLHRPIGIGVQGLADVFALMDIPYHSEEAKEVNKLIFETIYHASLVCSNELAISRNSDMKIINNILNLYSPEYVFLNENRTCREYNNLPVDVIDVFNRCKPIRDELNLTKDYCGAYSSFEGSPLSEGIFQFDMWDIKPCSNRYNWEYLRKSIIKYGIRNSLLVAPMPTASTAQILGNNECFEPFTSNIYSRRTLAGDYVLPNKYLMKELIDLNIWSEDLKNNIILNKGSIQHIEIIPQHIRDKYKIVWEIPMKHMIDMAADRGAYVCQSQSLNLWMEDPNYKTMTSMHFYSWNKGLKTGIYYLRRKPKHQPQQFTIDPSKTSETENNETNEIDEDVICESCSG